MFPFKVCKITDAQTKLFEKHFAEFDGKFYFEGIWLRNQRRENYRQSGYKDEKTADRRYIQFYDTYEVRSYEKENFLVVSDTYVHISSTYPKKEIKKYKNKIVKALKFAGFEKKGKTLYKKEEMILEIVEHKNHPKNEQAKIKFPKNYQSIDVTFRTKCNNRKDQNEKMWRLSNKMFRMLDKRENPKYINNISEIEQYLPAQVEMGCGPSIEVGIPPLHQMHETYKVQSHKEKGRFYFREEDDLISNIILDTNKMYKKFSYVPKTLIQSSPTSAYDAFNRLYKKGVFKGTVFNNNFDRLVKRYNIPEFILRVYDRDKYIPKIDFDPDVKSLICIGTHADRRQVQRQARDAGLKVIFIDPEGFFDRNGNFVDYLIEGPKSSDLIYKTTFNNAMKELEKLLV